MASPQWRFNYEKVYHPSHTIPVINCRTLDCFLLLWSLYIHCYINLTYLGDTTMKLLTHVKPPDPVAVALVDFLLTITLVIGGSWLFTITLDWWLP